MATKSPTKLKAWLTGEEQKAEHERFAIEAESAVAVDPVEAAEQAYREKMSSGEAPAWARPATNDAHVAPPVSEDEIKAKLAALEVEHEAALKTLADVQAKQVEVLNTQLAAQKAAEQETFQSEAVELPNRLKSTLQTVRDFVAPTPERVVESAASEDPIKRGQDALARALRRSRGEPVEEPDFTAYVPPLKAGETALQTQVRLRVSPTLVAVAERHAEILVWETKCGEVFESLNAARGEEISVIEMLLKGIPATQATYAMAQSLVRAVQQAVEMKTTLVKTIERETLGLEQIIGSIPRRGSMRVQNDFSNEHYQLEKEIVSTMLALRTVSADAVQGLWSAAKNVATRLDALAALRAEHAGQAVAPLEMESKSLAVANARESEWLTQAGDRGGRSRAITDGKVFPS